MKREIAGSLKGGTEILKPLHLLFAIALFLATNPVWAATVRLYFEGTSYSAGHVGTGFGTYFSPANGSAVSGYFDYDEAGSGIQPSTFSVTIGGFTFSASSYQVIANNDSNGSPGNTIDVVRIGTNSAAYPLLVNGSSLPGVSSSWSFYDYRDDGSPADALTGPGLPTILQLTNLALWGGRSGQLRLENAASTEIIYAQYVVNSVSTVPLPAAAWLLLSGLAGLGFVGRRKAH